MRKIKHIKLDDSMDFRTIFVDIKLKVKKKFGCYKEDIMLEVQTSSGLREIMCINFNRTLSPICDDRLYIKIIDYMKYKFKDMDEFVFFTELLKEELENRL
ncbi:MAG: hypothetical protein ACRCX2_14955 [Paraclostridium sp.]